MIVGDRGAAIRGASAALAQLAERIQAPVVTTLDAKDMMVEDHPLFRGALGAYGRSCANHVVAEADLVIYCGSTTSDHTTANYKMPKEGTTMAFNEPTRKRITELAVRLGFRELVSYGTRTLKGTDLEIYLIPPTNDREGIREVSMRVKGKPRGGTELHFGRRSTLKFHDNRFCNLVVPMTKTVLAKTHQLLKEKTDDKR